MMDPVVSLKRPLSADFSVCLFCQTKRGHLRKATSQGIQTVSRVLEVRKKTKDDKNRDVIDRLAYVFGSDCCPVSALVWHGTCHALFTDINKIQRLQDAVKPHSARSTCSITGSGVSLTKSFQQQCTGTSRTCRSSVQPMNYNLCMFCQVVKQKVQLSLAVTLRTSHEGLQSWIILRGCVSQGSMIWLQQKQNTIFHASAHSNGPLRKQSAK